MTWATLTHGYLRRARPWRGRCTNVRSGERWASLALGLLLAGVGLAARRRGVAATAAAAGGMLAERGLSGRCALYRLLRITST